MEEEYRYLAAEDETLKAIECKYETPDQEPPYTDPFSRHAPHIGINARGDKSRWLDADGIAQLIKDIDELADTLSSNDVDEYFTETIEFLAWCRSHALARKTKVRFYFIYEKWLR